jgi:hypothetical protein
MTFSFPDDIAATVNKQKEKSKFLGMLVREWETKQATTPAATMSPQEVEIREALKKRKRLLQLYGEKITNIEWVIRKGEAPEGTMITVKDWHSYMRERGVEDENGYFETYAKYEGESVSDLWELWRDVQEKVREEEKVSRERSLLEEITSGMTRQDIIDKIDVYLESKKQEKTAHIMKEINKIDTKKDADAFDYKEKGELIKDVNRMENVKEVSVTLKELQKVYGLPYMTIYNKILPILRVEGYKII